MAKKTKKDLMVVQSPVNPSMQFIVASELADDEMIVNQLTGQVLPHYIFSFKDGTGHEQKGLSVFGVRESVRLLNKNPKSGSKIRLNPAYMNIDRNVEQNGQKGVEVRVFAEDLLTGSGAWGIKFEPYQKKGRNGLYENKFATEVALSKAERNAMRKLIPEKAAIAMIDKMIKSNGKEIVKPIEPPKDIIKEKNDFALARKMIEECKNLKVLDSWVAKIKESKKYEVEEKQDLLLLIEKKKHE